MLAESPYVLMEEEAIDGMINDWPDKRGSRTLFEFLELVCNSSGFKGDLSPEVLRRASSAFTRSRAHPEAKAAR